MSCAASMHEKLLFTNWSDMQYDPKKSQWDSLSFEYQRTFQAVDKSAVVSKYGLDFTWIMKLTLGSNWQHFWLSCEILICMHISWNSSKNVFCQCVSHILALHHICYTMPWLIPLCLAKLTYLYPCEHLIHVAYVYINHISVFTDNHMISDTI